MDWLSISLAVLAALAHLLGFFHAAHALMHTRTSQGTIAWLVSLVMLPYFAVPLYWFLGRRRFWGYVRARRSDDEFMSMHFSKYRLQVADKPESKEEQWHPLFIPLEKLAGLPVTTKNEVNLLINGEKTFERMFEAIENAKHYVLVEFFIVKDDQLGTRFTKLLAERARAGIEVYFIYDEVGSFFLKNRSITELKNAGVKVEPFGSSRKGSRFQINFRNHRKIVVVDGVDAFVGGLNIGDEYTGVCSRFGSWRDTHLHLRGRSVQCVQLVFLEDWQWAADADLPELRWWSELEDDEQPKTGQKRTLVVPTGPADLLESCLLMFVAAIEQARERIWIATPYFVPDEAVVVALQNAALRGVDVRILIPKSSDNWLVYLSSFSYFSDTEEAGVKLYRYEKGFMHQKVLLMDSSISAVGTANLDNRSFRLNFEIMVFVDNKEFNAEVAQMLEKDFILSREIDHRDYEVRPLWFRAGVRLARILAPVQ